MDCTFCFRPTHDIIHTCHFGQCLFLTSSKDQESENSNTMKIWLLASGLGRHRECWERQRLHIWKLVTGKGLESLKNVEHPLPHPRVGWNLALGFRDWEDRLSVLSCNSIKSIDLGKSHGCVICLLWCHLTDLHNIAVFAMWIHRLHKQSGSLSLITVISKALDCSEQGNPFCYRIKSECILIQAHFNDPFIITPLEYAQIANLIALGWKREWLFPSCLSQSVYLLPSVEWGSTGSCSCLWGTFLYGERAFRRTIYIKMSSILQLLALIILHLDGSRTGWGLTCWSFLLL